MPAYLLRRLAFLVVSLVVAMIAIFVLLRLLPGDPANALLSVNATPEQIAAARAQVGSDQPLLQQFATWAGQLIRFDLGDSFLSSRPVGPDIAARLAVTLPLTLIAFIVALLVSLIIGITAAVKSDRWYGIALSGFAQLGVAVPVFWVGVVLVWIFALGLGALPSGGFPRDDWEDPADALRSLTLPVITIVIVMSASLSRYVRSATLDVLGSDYLRTARAGGSGMAEALLRHGVRNGAVPVVAILGIELSTTLLGAVVVESVFTLPGLGSLLLSAIEQHDFQVIQGVLVVSTLFVLLVGFAADIVQRLIDPRLRTSVSGNR
ncbi:Glutathione transport system permease protein GsiC [Microbacterium oxydans]|uniref:Glutathione transport system permease protein GsiC n=1 Tax=Microbacterium oxydans TaxID=82380 RepID=A0A0F0LLW2_9MICO|nr:ABC transporter permease [Microbacterium oxydans]KJL34192.1 Glutathione transport system permease protein GsiC [Microbacterium oxydans]CAH0259407.1 Glutathione transport system permease protein GsiC [Microbacterium oxydans]